MIGVTHFVAIVLAGSVLLIAPAAEGGTTQGAVKVDCSTTGRAPIKANLTGTWRGDDGGTYWIRQVGTCIWWSGFSGPVDTPTMGRNFSNVLAGSIVLLSSRPYISGYWADVPRGSILSSGTLLLEIRTYSSGKPSRLFKRRYTGGFGGSSWTQSAG